MQWEVEQKFPVTDPEATRATLEKLGAHFGLPVHQADHYFNHPARDFAQTDEALRIRQERTQNFITYKGPRKDATTKTRQELEIQLPQGADVVSQLSALLTALGFRPVATVRKARTPGMLQWNGRQVLLAIDFVDQVGSFLELEILAVDSEIATAQTAVASVARRLGLEESERRSYLELLISDVNGCHQRT